MQRPCVGNRHNTHVHRLIIKSFFSLSNLFSPIEFYDDSFRFFFFCKYLTNIQYSLRYPANIFFVTRHHRRHAFLSDTCDFALFLFRLFHFLIRRPNKMPNIQCLRYHKNKKNKCISID